MTLDGSRDTAHAWKKFRDLMREKCKEIRAQGREDAREIEERHAFLVREAEELFQDMFWTDVV